MSVARPVTVDLEAGMAVHLSNGTHDWSGDEPEAVGGTDTGPNPYEQLLGALGTCTALTLRMYADHKQIDLRSVAITATFSQEEDGETKRDVIRSTVVLRGTFDEAQKERLTQVAGRCPVHKTLQGGPTMIETVSFEET